MSNVLGYDVCGVKSEWYFNDAGYEVRASCTHKRHDTGAHSWQATVDAAEKEDLDDYDPDAVDPDEEAEPDADQEAAQSIINEAQRASDALPSADVTLTADEQIRAMKALLLDAYSIKIPLHAARKLGPDRLRFLVGMCAGAWSGGAGPHYISGTEGRDLS